MCRFFANVSVRAENLFLTEFMFLYPVSKLLAYVSLTFRRSSRSRSELRFKLSSGFWELLSGSQLSLHTPLFQSLLLKPSMLCFTKLEEINISFIS